VEEKKENVIPSRFGRKTAFLSELSSPQEILDRKASFEREISDAGRAEDLLHLFHRYTFWAIEQFPASSGRVGSVLMGILDRALAQGEIPARQESILEHEKFLELWMIYADHHPDPISVWKQADGLHVGQSHARFYSEFARAMECAGNSTAANHLFRRGISRNAQPLDFLLVKYRAFKQRQQPGEDLMSKPQTLPSHTNSSNCQTHHGRRAAFTFLSNNPHLPSSLNRPSANDENNKGIRITVNVPTSARSELFRHQQQLAAIGEALAVPVPNPKVLDSSLRDSQNTAPRDSFQRGSNPVALISHSVQKMQFVPFEDDE